MKTIWIIVCLVLVMLVAAYIATDYYSTVPDDTQRTFVGRATCIECHQEQAEAFKGSHHDLAMDVAEGETVLGNFDDQTLSHHGLTSKMFRDGERYMVRTDGLDGKLRDFEVKYVFGVHPLQQYMVELPQKTPAKPGAVGRVQVLRETWDAERKQWYYLNPPDVDELLQPGDPLHWTGSTQSWNTSCAECHSTNLQKNFDVASNSFHTTFTDIDVSCESCHGPGSLHVELAKSKSLFWDRKQGMGLVKLKTIDNIPQVETCAPCHSRRMGIQGGHVAGAKFSEHYACNLLSTPTYHAGGQIRDEDYVYGSFIQSKMYHNNIKCTDCHDPHSLKLKHEGNQLCTSCHQHPAAKYDSPSHHFHQEGTAGSQCIDCHMAATTYMGIDSRRDHSFRVPRPDLSVALGTPNACTGCHIQPESLSPKNQKKVTQYLNWIEEKESGNKEIADELERINKEMAAAVVKWYGETSPSRDNTYYERLAEVSAGGDVKKAVALLNDREVPDIIRATSVFELRGDTSLRSLNAALDALSDRDPMVVSAALMRIENEVLRMEELDQDNGKMNRLMNAVAEKLVHDSFRVRMDAARAFVLFPPQFRQRVSRNVNQDFNQAFDDLKKSTLAEADRVESHLLMAGLHQRMNDIQGAKAALERAIRVAPTQAGARASLASLMESEARSMQQNAMSSGQPVSPGDLQKILQKVRQMGQQIQQLRLEEHRLLEVDVERAKDLKNMHGLHYRFAMSSYMQGELDKTEKHLLIANKEAPENETYLLGLATYYEFVGDFEKAKSYTRELMRLDSENMAYKQLFQQIFASEKAAEKEDAVNEDAPKEKVEN